MGVSDGFEDGLSADWVHWQRLDRPPGVVEVISPPTGAHSGANVLLLDQDPWGSHQYMRRTFPEGFQGTITVWEYFPETLPPNAPVVADAGSLLLVEGSPGGTSVQVPHYTVEGIDADSTGVTVSSQVHDGTSHYSLWYGSGRFRIEGGGWHCLTVTVTNEGARGWYDGNEIPIWNPALTSATE